MQSDAFDQSIGGLFQAGEARGFAECSRLAVLQESVGGDKKRVVLSFQRNGLGCAKLLSSKGFRICILVRSS